uniref:Zn(2)-C6 fungal-type domain-containing protein n=1 Tax=Kwoniella dejecticola CBS 10117 TaxID=1296121 RepID=A0A1A6A7Q0_9TREE|nr:uncharacterized protein I303_03802 [Kwoniella dejecticola CBS 10117]OBR86084.1 hypothetical protein I303_03802 [Kwoniella dejecticola CBS 10117]
MKSHPPPDPRYPYANLLQPIPLDIHSQPQPPAQSSSSLAGGPASASTSLYHQPSSATSSTPTSAYFPNAGLLDIPLPDQAAQSSSMSNNSNLNSSSDSYTNPTKADILRRHSISRSYWDDPSPEQESLLASAPNSAKNSPSSGNQGGEVPKTSGRSGQKRRQKYTRTRTGCLCCRARRIKCDEGRPTCKRCIIAKKECQYPDPGEGEAKRPSGKGKHGSRGDSDASESEEEDRPAAKLPGIPYSSPDDGNGTGSAALGEVAWDASFVNPATTINGSSNSNLDYDSGLAIGTGLASSGEQYLAGQIGKQEWATSEGGGAPMLTTPNFLLPWFPTAEERSLILHYCANAASLMMAIPSGLNPMLAINLPLALDSPRGLNPSADALRVALLGTGAIHQAFLLARSGVANHQTAAMFQYASTLRDTGKEMVRRAVRDGNGAMTDAALGASTALGTIDIFFGGSGWMDNFNLAKEMVALRGGPAEMLKNSEPRKLTDGVTVSPARLMLEILAIYETFSCLTTGQEPDLFSDRWESWWLEASRSTYEEHSVEKQFGMSRIMVLLFARVTRLLARVSRSKLLITESPPTNLSLTDPSTTPFGSSDSLLSSLARGLTAEKDLDPLVIEARQLNRDVDAWIDSLQLSTLEHERVQVGNRAYAYAMKILLLTMVFKYPREDLRVQNAAQQVLQHCSWSTAALGMSIDLTWPAIIAGSCVNGASRQWVSTLLEGFKSQCCFDIETANRIILEVWRRADAGERRADWKNVCDDLGLQVL